ncbi:MAG: hypothetical protein QNJ71_10155, partial [Acidimicrobiia bacterium]|nr:hypothetical protein [Acidimicrobiia bacterium]
MEDLIQDIQRRTGLPTETVVEVVTMVADYIRSAVPEDLVDQVAVYLGKAAETAGGAAGSARSTVDQAGATA